MKFPLLPDPLKRLFASKRQASSVTVRDPALRALLGSRTQDERKTVLKAHPELVTDDALTALGRLVEQAGDPRARSVMEQYRRLLKLCREVGVDAAFQPIPDTPPGTPIGFVVQAFINTPGLEKKKALLASCPQLLRAETIDFMTRTAKEADDERTRKILQQHCMILEWCRSVGVDAAFAEVERQSRRPPPDPEVFNTLARVFGAKSVTEMEDAIRSDPRVVERDARELCRMYFATNRTLGVPEEKIQTCLRILEACERNGIDAAFAALKRAAPMSGAKSPESGESWAAAFPHDAAINQLIKKFASGEAATEVSRAAIAFIPFLQPIPRAACMLLAIVASVKAGEHAQARSLVVRLN